jgi:hypothetical protein
MVPRKEMIVKPKWLRGNNFPGEKAQHSLAEVLG